MLELFTADDYEEVRNRYVGKKVIIIPYGEKKIKNLRRYTLVLKLKNGVKYNYFQTPKYKKFNYFILISVSDIENNIFQVLKKIKEILGEEAINNDG